MFLIFQKTKHINWSLFRTSDRTLATIHLPFLHSTSMYGSFPMWYNDQGELNKLRRMYVFGLFEIVCPTAWPKLNIETYIRAFRVHIHPYTVVSTAHVGSDSIFNCLFIDPNFFYLDQHALWHMKLVWFSSVDALRTFGWIFFIAVRCATKLFGNEIIR